MVCNGYLIACLVLCGATFATADPALLRSTLIVADVDRAIAFYRQLDSRSRAIAPAAQARFAVSTPSASKTFRLLILQSSDPHNGKRGLLSFGEPEPPVLVPARDRLGVGDEVFLVSHPDAVAKFDVLDGLAHN